MTGYTFQPDQNNRLKQLNQGNGALGPHASEALRILSLRLPNFLGGGRPVAPAELLTPPVGGQAPGGAVVDSNRNAAGPAGAMRGPSSPSAPGQLIDLVNNAVPSPTFTPGQGGDPQAGPASTFRPPTTPRAPLDGLASLFDAILNRGDGRQI